MRLRTGIALLLIVSVSSGQLFGMTRDRLLKKAESLVREKKYNSAFKLLHSYEGSNNYPDLLVKKVDIALRFFVNSMTHQTFALSDLKKNQSLGELRGRAGNYDLYLFPADDLLKKAIIKYPNRGDLHRALGDYYFEVYSHFGDRWKMNAEQTLSLAEKQYLLAIKSGGMNYRSYDNFGVILIIQKRYDEAIERLKKSVFLNSGFGESYYHIAYAFMKQEKFDSAIQYAMKSLKHFPEMGDRAESLFVLGQLFEKKGMVQKGEDYYSQAHRLQEKNYKYLKALVISNLQMNRKNRGRVFAEKMIELNPHNIGIIKDIVYIYGELGFADDVVIILTNQENRYENNNHALGNLTYGTALCYSLYKKRFRKKRLYLKRAREYYKKVFPEDHDVFEIIDKELRQ